MSPPPSATVAAAASVSVVILLFFTTTIDSLGGSATTISVSYGSSITICSIVGQKSLQQIICWKDGQTFYPSAGVSFDSIAGGLDVFCGIRSGGYSLLCWDTRNFIVKRFFRNVSSLLISVTVGDSQICGLTNGDRNVECWRGDGYRFDSGNGGSVLSSISSGLGFSCGVVEGIHKVVCWGRDSDFSDIASRIESEFGDFFMVNVFVGGRHACGLNTEGFVICKGDNENRQLNVPNNIRFEYVAFALGGNYTCVIRRIDNGVECWGGEGDVFLSGVSFESIVAGLDFTCGLRSSDFSVVCWGPGWPANRSFPQGHELSLPQTLPGPCVRSSCKCGIYPGSQKLCFGKNDNICRPCDVGFGVGVGIVSPLILTPPPAAQPVFDNHQPLKSTSNVLKKGLLAFCIIGSIGVFAGICSVVYCVWTGICLGKRKIHNSVQPTITNDPRRSNSNPFSGSFTLMGQRRPRFMRRQRSGTSNKHPDSAEEFLFQDLALATDNFSSENKIGAGSFGVVYKGTLRDGREVAIKRGETNLKTKKFQEKESAFDSELAFLSRVHHKHLVRLVGYCEEKDERLLVYEYMKNGSLYYHLHDKTNVEKSSSIVNSWKIRVKISLDAARGVEYLHTYAVPPIIHRDIKSSNILLDSHWTARVSDFGLSLMGPGSNRVFSPIDAAGTVGYIDPEYYSYNVLTAKSDVYGLGVVLLELLTGKTSIFEMDEENEDGGGGEPISLVEYATPAITGGDLRKILDMRVGLPELHETEAVELVAYTALHCVNFEGKDRPSMSDIVANLERALSLFGFSHGSISSDTLSFISE